MAHTKQTAQIFILMMCIFLTVSCTRAKYAVSESEQEQAATVSSLGAVYVSGNLHDNNSNPVKQIVLVLSPNSVTVNSTSSEKRWQPTNNSTYILAATNNHGYFEFEAEGVGTYFFFLQENNAFYFITKITINSLDTHSVGVLQHKMTSDLTVFVADEAGVSLSGVSVLLPDNNQSFITNSLGAVSFTGIQPDTYSLSLSLDHYVDKSIEGVLVERGTTQSITVTMSLSDDVVETEWLTDFGEPVSTLGETGDYYLDNDTGAVYIKINDTWSQIGNITQNNESLENWETGTGDPIETDTETDTETGTIDSGEDGDYYFDQVSGQLYYKDGDTWVAIGSLESTDSTDSTDSTESTENTDSTGDTILWHSGSGVPDEDIGGVGDYYIDGETAFIYVKSTDGWVKITQTDETVEEEAAVVVPVTTGSLSGTVRSILESYEGVTVYVHGYSYVSFTDTDGYYSISNMVTGNYILSYAYSRNTLLFKSATSNVTVEAAKETVVPTVNLILNF